MTFVVAPAAAIPGWGFGTGIDDFGLISAVVTDSSGGVFVLSRSPHPAMHRFDLSGVWQGDWDYPFLAPHGLWVSPDGRVFVTDTEAQMALIFDLDGRLLQTIGKPGVKGEPGRPFNLPTRAVAGPSGDIYVSDGYGQNWVHRFRSDGQHLISWGGDGDAPGQFQTPHCLWVDGDERVYVVDRANGRVQVFDNEGRVLAIWGGFCFPHDIFQLADGTFVVTDCAPRDDDSRPYHEQLPAQPLIVLNRDGARIGATGVAGDGPGYLLDCPHSIWVDPFGDVYVSEVTACNRLQKFHGQ